MIYLSCVLIIIYILFLSSLPTFSLSYLFKLKDGFEFDSIDSIVCTLDSTELKNAISNAKNQICSLHKHSTTWNDGDFDVYIQQLSLSKDCEKALDYHQSLWSKSSNKKEASIFRYLIWISDLKNQASIWSQCNRGDVDRWIVAFEQIKKLSLSNGSGLSQLAEKCGAEDHSLHYIRVTVPLHFNTFISSVTLSPHIAIGLFRLLYGQKLDQVIYGVDESEEKSPWNLYLYVTSPGVLSLKYFYGFVDTNFIEAYVLMFVCLISDITFWFELLTFAFTDEKKSAINQFLSRNIIAINWFIGLFLCFYFIMPFLSSNDYDMLCFLLECFLLYKAFETLRVQVKLFYEACIFRYYIMSVVDKSKRDELKGKVTSLLKNEKKSLIIEDNNWNQHYTKVHILGRGSYGEVWEGSAIGDANRKVAIKTLFTDNTVENPRPLLKLFMHFTESVLSVNKSLMEKTVVRTMQQFKHLKDDDYIRFRHEVLVLKALPKHPSLLEIHNAYRTDTSRILVMNLAVELVKKIKKISPINGEEKECIVWNPLLDHIFKDPDPSSMMRKKLNIVQTFFSGLAALHDHGVVHRDVKPLNLSVRADDHSVATIIDMGSCYCPGTEYYQESLVDIQTDLWSPPESIGGSIQVKNREKHANDAPLAKILAQGYKGPPVDVWAAALTAIQIITCKPFDMNVNDNKNDLDILEEIPYMFYDEIWTTSSNQVDLQILRQNDVVMQCLVAVGKSWTLDKSQRLLIHFIRDKNFGKLDDSLIFMLKQMLHPSNIKRLSMKQAASHIYFQKNHIGEYRRRAEDDINKSSSNDNGVNGEGRIRNTCTSRQFISYNNGGLISRRINILRELMIDMSSYNDPATTGSVPTAPIAPTAFKIKEGVKHMNEKEGNDFVNALVCSFTLYGNPKGINNHQWEQFFKDNLTSILPHTLPSDIFDLLDSDGNGFIDKCELLSGLCFILSFVTTQETRLRLLFCAYDLDGNCLLTLYEFENMLQALNINNLTMEIQDMFKRIDTDNRGELSIDAFIAGIKKDRELSIALFAEDENTSML